ncbi:MAG: RDD family protein [Pseudomonadota bacterium]|nr:RDD family protein [Pseudomonadota bacterium]
MSRRMACFVYEGMMLFGLLLIPGAIGALFVAVTGSAHPLVLEVIAFVVFGIYFTWFWSRRGQTLPMQTWHILVLTTSGQPLSQPRALLRYAASCAWFAPAWLIKVLNHWTGWDGIAALGIGVVAYALLALLHPQRQFWHDAICGTQLIDAKPEPRRKS